MITLGLNAAFHDSAAALVIDGVTVAASEEERYTRIKHAKRPLPFSAWELPHHAIDDCLAQARLTLDDVDHIAYSFAPRRFYEGREDGLGREEGSWLPLTPSARADAAGRAGLRPWDSPWDGLFASLVASAPRMLVDAVPHHLRRRFLPRTPGAPRPWRWHWVDHHVCHQASAFLAAPFDRCAVMTLDGRGEAATTTYGVYQARAAGGHYRPLGQVGMPHSLGLLYERVTSHLGFLSSSDEYKVMALAAMGRPRFQAALEAGVHVGADGQYRIEPPDLDALVGPRRGPGEPLLAAHLDLTASLQAVLERTVLQLARWLREASGERQLALAGGVALNCLMNARLRDAGLFEHVWVQPAAGDAGTALGAALWIDARERQAALDRGDAATAVPMATVTAETAATAETVEARSAAPDGSVALAPRQWTMTHAYLGPGADEQEIEALLRWSGLQWTRPDDLSEAVAERLAAQAIVGWFQGRMEWGPRALGARSILASPIEPGMQARLNELKDREDFRPVAPVVPVEAFGDWFEPAAANGGQSPYMLFIYDVKPERAARIPSACHVDRSARVQTVEASSNAALHALLQAFGRRTGTPVLVNTSFNVRGQPVVCRPRDALEAFYTTPLDVLAIGPFLVEKPGWRAGRAGAATGGASSVRAEVGS